MDGTIGNGMTDTPMSDNNPIMPTQDDNASPNNPQQTIMNTDEPTDSANNDIMSAFQQDSRDNNSDNSTSNDNPFEVMTIDPSMTNPVESYTEVAAAAVADDWEPIENIPSQVKKDLVEYQPHEPHSSTKSSVVDIIDGGGSMGVNSTNLINENNSEDYDECIIIEKDLGNIPVMDGTNVQRPLSIQQNKNSNMSMQQPTTTSASTQPSIEITCINSSHTQEIQNQQQPSTKEGVEKSLSLESFSREEPNAFDILLSNIKHEMARQNSSENEEATRANTEQHYSSENSIFNHESPSASSVQQQQSSVNTSSHHHHQEPQQQQQLDNKINQPSQSAESASYKIASSEEEMNAPFHNQTKDTNTYESNNKPIQPDQHEEQQRDNDEPEIDESQQTSIFDALLSDIQQRMEESSRQIASSPSVPSFSPNTTTDIPSNDNDGSGDDSGSVNGTTTMDTDDTTSLVPIEDAPSSPFMINEESSIGKEGHLNTPATSSVQSDIDGILDKIIDSIEEDDTSLVPDEENVITTVADDTTVGSTKNKNDDNGNSRSPNISDIPSTPIKEGSTQNNEAPTNTTPKSCNMRKRDGIDDDGEFMDRNEDMDITAAINPAIPTVQMEQRLGNTDVKPPTQPTPTYTPSNITSQMDEVPVPELDSDNEEFISRMKKQNVYWKKKRKSFRHTNQSKRRKKMKICISGLSSDDVTKAERNNAVDWHDSSSVVESSSTPMNDGSSTSHENIIASTTGTITSVVDDKAPEANAANEHFKSSKELTTTSTSANANTNTDDQVIANHNKDVNDTTVYDSDASSSTYDETATKPMDTQEIKRLTSLLQKEKDKICQLLQEKFDSQFKSYKEQIQIILQRLHQKEKNEKDALCQKKEKLNELHKKNMISDMSRLEKIKEQEEQKIRTSPTTIPQQQQILLHQVQERCHKKELSLQKKGFDHKAKIESEFKDKTMQTKRYYRTCSLEMKGKLKKFSERCKQQYEEQKRFFHDEHERKFNQRHGLPMNENSSMSLSKVKESTTKSSSSTNIKSKSLSGQKRSRNEDNVVNGGDDPISRMENRKAVQKKAFQFQYSVEIHNEGISHFPRISSGKSSLDKVSSSKSRLSDLSEFIPWGAKARQFLFSILCGEIPTGAIMSFEDGRESLQGGQVKFMLTDMRTSDENASKLRIWAVRQWQLRKDKSGRYASLTKVASSARKAMSNAVKQKALYDQATEKTSQELERAVKKMDALRRESLTFFSSDGIPTRSEENHQKLNQAICKYEAATKEAQARNELATEKYREATMKVESLTEEYKKAFKDFQKASRNCKLQDSSSCDIDINADDMSTILQIVFEKRRKYWGSNQQKAEHEATMENNGEESNESSHQFLEKNFLDKMKQKYKTIVLRPTESSMLEEVLTMTDKSMEKKAAGAKLTEADLLESRIRAEQLFVLSLHPASPSPPLSSIPPSSSSSDQRWAEPGWHVVLGVNNNSKSEGSILPCDDAGNIVRDLTNKCGSVSGRQVASIFSPFQLKNLMNEMSEISRRSAPAEWKSKELLETETLELVKDPISISEEEIMLSYDTYPRPKQVKSHQPPSIKDSNPSQKKELVPSVSKSVRHIEEPQHLSIPTTQSNLPTQEQNATGARASRQSSVSSITSIGSVTGSSHAATNRSVGSGGSLRVNNKLPVLAPPVQAQVKKTSPPLPPQQHNQATIPAQISNLQTQQNIHLNLMQQQHLANLKSIREQQLALYQQQQLQNQLSLHQSQQMSLPFLPQDTTQLQGPYLQRNSISSIGSIGSIGSAGAPPNSNMLQRPPQDGNHLG